MLDGGGANQDPSCKLARPGALYYWRTVNRAPSLGFSALCGGCGVGLGRVRTSRGSKTSNHDQQEEYSLSLNELLERTEDVSPSSTDSSPISTLNVDMRIMFFVIMSWESL